MYLFFNFGMSHICIVLQFLYLCIWDLRNAINVSVAILSIFGIWKKILMGSTQLDQYITGLSKELHVLLVRMLKISPMPLIFNG